MSMTKTNFNHITQVDCTLRDGGYYTNWHFDDKLVYEYLNFCSQIGIDVIELGYINFTDNNTGTFANLPESLSKFSNPPVFQDKIHFAAMVDIKDFNSTCPEHISHKLQLRISQSAVPIKILRLAIHYKKIHTVLDYIKPLQNVGFKICINIMQINLATQEEIKICLNILRQFNDLSAVYIADSLGSFYPNKLKLLIEDFKNNLSHPIGFHAHDNIGLALHNSLIAIESGATWIDSTFCGMGRGAGNAKTEQLYPLLHQNISQKTKLNILSFIAQHFEPLQKHYRWDASALYSICGIKQLHPTYLQLIEENEKLSVRQKIDILFHLADLKAYQFSKQLLEEATNSYV